VLSWTTGVKKFCDFILPNMIRKIAVFRAIFLDLNDSKVRT
jgi:hypothetical protein